MSLFGKYKMALHLDKKTYKPEEIIKGTVRLYLKKSLNGRKLEAALVGTLMRYHEGCSYSGHDGRHHRHFRHQNRGHYAPSEVFYMDKITLGEEREYYNDEAFTFEIKIPSNVHDNEPKFEGWLKKAIELSDRFGGHPPYIEWYVKTQLDVPMKIDLRKTQKIEIL